MVDAVTVIGLSPRKFNQWLVVGLVLASVLVLLPSWSTLSLIGSALLFCVIPGVSLVNLVFAKSEQVGLLERLLLGVATSYVLSNLVVLGLTLLSMDMKQWQVVMALDVLSVGLLAGATMRNRGEDRALHVEPGRVWAYVLVLLVVLGVFRFVGLGYAQFGRADEIPIASLVNQLVHGHGGEILTRGKPPAEVTTVLAFVLFQDGYGELALRAPFALASVVSVLLLYLLGREMFSLRVGLLSALLMSLGGIYLAVSRMAQYQAIVMLMSVTSVYCFWRATRPESGSDRSKLMVLGGLAFGFGLLTHYDTVLVLPVLLIMCLSDGRLRKKSALSSVLLSTAVVLALASLYYLPLIVQGQFVSQQTGLVAKRGVATGLFNNVQSFVLSEMLFRNSVYYVFFMLAALAGSLVLEMRRAVSSKFAVFVGWALLTTGLVISVCCPIVIQVGSVNLGVLFVVPVLTMLLLGGHVPLNRRIVWIWFLTSLVLYGFLVSRPGTHWYNMISSWALLGGTAVDAVLTAVERRTLSRPLRWSVWGLFSALVLLSAGFLYLFFLQRVPVYALDFPEHKNRLYWTPQTSLPWGFEAPFFGVPRQNGWKAVGYLYRAGVLRGHFRLTTPTDTLEWYLGHKWDWDDDSRYILYSEGPELTYQNIKIFIEDASQETIEQWYRVIGRVLVHGVPRILIYERRDTAQEGSPVDYEFEEYGTLYDEVASLRERLRFDELGVGKKTYSRVAGLVEQMSEPGDEIVFTEREQVGVFSGHYTGTLPYRVPERTLTPHDLESMFETQSGNGKVYIVLWGRPGENARAHWDEWLEKSEDIVEKVWSGNVGLAVWDGDGVAALHLLEGSRLGESIELLAYETSYVERDTVLRLVLYWAMEDNVWRDYTVFTHVVDGQGSLVAQKDNPPGGGLTPTSTWRTDSVIRDEYVIPLGHSGAGEHSIEVGMYQAESGERLPATGEGALPDGRIRLEHVVTR